MAKKVVFYVVIMLIFTNVSVMAYDYKSIQVDGCHMNVIVAVSIDEKIQGLLGQTEESFKYDAMLFQMGGTEIKTFHTEAMLTGIRIMGVKRTGKDNYKTVSSAFYAEPGIKAIDIEGEDVLEITEYTYRNKFKKCLNNSGEVRN